MRSKALKSDIFCYYFDVFWYSANQILICQIKLQAENTVSSELDRQWLIPSLGTEQTNGKMTLIPHYDPFHNQAHQMLFTSESRVGITEKATKTACNTKTRDWKPFHGNLAYWAIFNS